MKWAGQWVYKTENDHLMLGPVSPTDCCFSGRAEGVCPLGVWQHERPGEVLVLFVSSFSGGESWRVRPLVAGHWSILGHLRFQLLHTRQDRQGVSGLNLYFGVCCIKQNHHWKDDCFPEYSGVTMRFLSSFHGDRHARQAYRPCRVDSQCP